ncbi:PAS domain-containing protein [Cognatazoarcus halotolerans]|uniref:PAS domain-containing protein n=1 Tax=Cognatazoarcus halotolerans TaxID=2686016 RepID=UPI0013573123|nr:PAS domain-containing protein [Cognatazoarcus halotolerans]MCB1897845.1 PAS domain-containing protein [Rhodocyclaceae bacterium]MCP5311755.1 PAS domain-containing protein [Zoogloeaceae bacterium]
MKRAIVPTQAERVMRDDDFIVSKTDPKGIITYGNPIFVEFSGYTEDELIGTQHNIIRHPDMPRSAFKLAWDTIASGREFFAYVKNMSKDGGFYWVFAHISPDLDADGRIIGYSSVRRCPKRSAIEAIAAVYARMLAAEKAAGARNAIAAGTQVLVEVMSREGMSYEELVFAV